MKKLLLFLGVGGLAYGVYNFYAKQVELLNYLSYKIVGIKIINTTVENIDLEVLLEIQNNSEINLTITDYYFDVFINGIAVGKIVNTTINQRFNGFGNKSVFPLSVRINNSVFFGEQGLIKGLVSNLSDSRLDIVGYYGVKKGLLKFKNIEINETLLLKEYL